jgi:hypothetical protein
MRAMENESMDAAGTETRAVSLGSPREGGGT